jgi:hypothetical protein
MCSTHGKQELSNLIFWAKVELACGCVWKQVRDEWVFEGNVIEKHMPNKSPAGRKRILSPLNI